jgi:hypothetical protein
MSEIFGNPVSRTEAYLLAQLLTKKLCTSPIMEVGSVFYNENDEICVILEIHLNKLDMQETTFTVFNCVSTEKCIYHYKNKRKQCFDCYDTFNAIFKCLIHCPDNLVILNTAYNKMCNEVLAKNAKKIEDMQIAHQKKLEEIEAELGNNLIK